MELVTQSLHYRPWVPVEDVARSPLSTYAACHEPLLLAGRNRVARLIQMPGAGLVFAFLRHQWALCAHRPAHVSALQTLQKDAFLKIDYFVSSLGLLRNI